MIPAKRTLYKVVANHEGQYSIWPLACENAPSRNDAGKRRAREECLPYIEATGGCR
ncbi:MAG: MbtH family NRPS accessory protein [Chloroflexota bacterium]